MRAQWHDLRKRSVNVVWTIEAPNPLLLAGEISLNPEVMHAKGGSFRIQHPCRPPVLGAFPIACSRASFVLYDSSTMLG